MSEAPALDGPRRPAAARACRRRKNLNRCVPTLEITMEDGASMHMIESGAMVALLADDCKD